MKKCKGGCQMKSGGKTCKKCGCDMEDEEYEKGEKEMRSGGMACMKCGGKMHKSGGTISSCMKCGGGKYTFGGKVKWEKKYASGGAVDTGCPDGMVRDPFTGKCVYPYVTSDKNDPRFQSYQDSSYLHNSAINLRNAIKNNPNAPISKIAPYQSINLGYEKKDLVKRYPGDMYERIYPTSTSTVMQATGQPWRVDHYDAPKTPVVYKPEVRVPVTEYTQQDLDNAIKQRREQEDYAAYIKWVAENPLPEPEPQINDEMEITYYKPVDMPMIKSGLIPANDPLSRKVYAGPGANTGRVKPIIPMPNQMWERGPGVDKSLQEQYATDKQVIVNPEEFIKSRTSSQKKKGINKKDYASGGMIKRADGSYSQRGLWDNVRANIGSGKKPTEQMLKQEKKIKQNMSFGGAINSMKKYFYGGEIDNTKITTDPEIQLGRGAFNVPEPAYDANEIMSKVFKNALSLKENDLPVTAQTGYKEEVEKNKVVKDDKSLPNWGRARKEQQILNELIRKDIASGRQKMDLLVEDDIIGDYTLGAMRAYEASGQYKRPELFKDKWLAEYKKQWDQMQKGKSSAGNQETKTETKTGAGNSLADKKFNFKKSNPTGKTNSSSSGWPKEQLLKEGGVEINTSELLPKDFDTYEPIKGITKSTKGVRATGRDRSDAYFDAVEKGQYFDLNGLKANTSLKLINDLLSKSKKAIVIPKGQDPYGRDLNDIYLQDENDPNKYHALDSLGVVNKEAIFGQYLTGEESKMTDRQKMITGQAQEKGGFKYNMSPWLFRETKNFNDQSSKDNKIEYTKTDDEIINRKPKSKAASESAKNNREWTVESMIPANAARTSTTLILRSGNETTVKTVPKPINKLIGNEVEVDIDGRKRKIYVDPYKKY